MSGGSARGSGLFLERWACVVWRMNIKPLGLRLGFLAAVVAGIGGLAARPLALADLFKLHRVGDPQISPDGKNVAYVVTDVVFAENRTNSDIWVVPAAGGRPKQLTNSPKHDRHPRWSPDGKWIAFESSRDGEAQIWVMSAAGGEPKKLTTLSTGAGQPMWSPDGKQLAFVSSVFAEFSAKPFKESDRLNKEKADARAKSKVKARLFTQLLYRHWDSWVEDQRQHLFVVPVTNGGAAGEPRDVTPGENDAVPTSSTFSAGDEFAWSPDGKEIVFTAPPSVTREQAWTTNHDIFSVNLATGARKNLTEGNKAADGLPRFSPDGKFLAYRAQTRAGFEADLWQLWVLDLASGERRSLTASFDSSVGYFAWAPDGKTIYFEALDQGSAPVWSVALAGGKPQRLSAKGVNSDVGVSPDGRWVTCMHQSMNEPAEVMRLNVGGTTAAEEALMLTRTNADLLSGVTMQEPESVVVPGAGGTPVQMWIVRPPNFDASKKYPLVFWVHGGPQSAFNNSWSNRWNAQVWAAQGYVIALPNPRGSVGFGQRFTDEISRDWGGKVFDDLMACLGYLERQSFVDPTHMAAAGASFGGYMMSWFQGHTEKFKTLVTHDGVYNFESMYGTTEEVWFDEWEHGIPWEQPNFNKFSPHIYAAKFKTPNLIIHNELDFRVPIGEGQALFTTLQRQGIPSKLLSFPDEGHWVLKPQNSELWHTTIFDWLEGYLKK
jgi:dipeptidyl aminopeptidase/acylaminoacyl peptidase